MYPQTLPQHAFTTHGCSDALVNGGTAIYNHDATQRELFVFDIASFLNLWISESHEQWRTNICATYYVTSLVQQTS